MEELIFKNENQRCLDEVLRGIMAAQPGKFRRMEDEFSYTLLKKILRDDRVRILVSGGGGRGPFFEGLVGEGMADAMVSGEFDCAPNAYMIYRTAKEIDCGKGVLLLTNNYMGDYLNNDMAQELLEAEGISSRVCYASDDVYSAGGEPKECRGGLCGISFMMKTASAAAKAGASLEEVYKIAEKANRRTRSLSLLYNREENQIEFGRGFSGERAAEYMAYCDTDIIAEKAAEVLLKELDKYESDTVHVMINRMLYMSYAEGYIMLNALRKALEKRKRSIGICTAGNYLDVYHANGCIVSLIAADEELGKYMKYVNGFDFAI